MVTIISVYEPYQRIGSINALIILAESGDLRRFRHYRQYLNFCGFNLSAVQKRTAAGRYKLSKRGNACLRYAYWLAAVNAVRQRENSFATSMSVIIKKDPENADLKRKAGLPSLAKVARVAHALVKQKPYTVVSTSMVMDVTQSGRKGASRPCR